MPNTPYHKIEMTSIFKIVVNNYYLMSLESSTSHLFGRYTKEGDQDVKLCRTVVYLIMQNSTVEDVYLIE
jgi:hypothetical protein